MTELSCTLKIHTVCRHLIPFTTSNLQSRHGLVIKVLKKHGGGTNVTVTIHTILGDYTKLSGILM